MGRKKNSDEFDNLFNNMIFNVHSGVNVNDFQAGANLLHECYEAHLNAGFTDQQALAITIAIITASMRGGGNDGK